MKTDFDIIIIGAGLVGLTTALACAHSGANVALLDRHEITVGHDPRATALSASSITLLDNLGIDVSEALQPIQDMLITEGLANSPWKLHFQPSEENDDLGALIENTKLKAALLKHIKAAPSIQCLAPILVSEFETTKSGVTVTTDQGAHTAKLLVAADGRNSALRQKAGITSQRFDYEAASLVTTISHALPHDGLAWQKLIKGGALAVLPLTDQRSQIVWSGPTKSIQAAEAISEPAFLDLLSEKMEGYLGDMECVAPRQSYPLRLQIADSFTATRFALVGDAAHAIHPLAGQGLNLGFRDAAALASGVNEATQTGQDIGVTSLLEYDLWRNADIRLLGALTHMISESSGFKNGPIGHARRLGLALVNQSSTLKKQFAKNAAGESTTLPKLLQKRL